MIPEQEYFVDGMVDEIMTSTQPHTVALRHRAQLELHLQGSGGVDVKQVGRELGVSYVLEGSVRKAGSSVYASPRQLIEAGNRAHISGPIASTARSKTCSICKLRWPPVSPGL